MGFCSFFFSFYFQTANIFTRYRGGNGGGGGGGEGGAAGNGAAVAANGGGATNSSLDSLDDCTSNESQESNGTRGSLGEEEEEAAGGTAETLPCGSREVSTTVTHQSSHPHEPAVASSSFHWTLSNWGAQQVARRRNNAGGTVRVDLASPEDISLDTDSTRFSAYGTTV